MNNLNRTRLTVDCWHGLEDLEQRLLLNGVVATAGSHAALAINNTAPLISFPTPSDGATSVGLNPEVAASVEDPDGDAMNLTFQFYISATDTWQTVRTFTGVGNSRYTASIASLVSQVNTTHQWRLIVEDAAGGVTTGTYTFTTMNPTAATPPLTLEWQTQLTLSPDDFRERQFHPVMGDVDNDKQQEIVLTAGANLYVLNGKTGAIKWSINGDARETACELADLNKDGVPEILYGLTGTRLRAVRGDGKILWTTAKLTGADQPQFPILTADIDGDGYPSIYFLTEDQSPEEYSGNLADYTGAVNMLDQNGKVLRTTWIYHPCWGGASLADMNGDGRFELYVSDRENGYNGVPSNGLSAFDAATLTPLWSRPDIHHSSAMAVITDVDGDGKLDLVAQKIVYWGPMILDPMTGATITDYSDRYLPTHGTGTVYDIDGDGHKEDIFSTSYPMEDRPLSIFTVFDLTTGEVEFEPTLEVHSTWPPRVGDVNGDGKMEILAALGDQTDRTGTNALLIYDSQYNLLQRVELSRSGQLSPAKVFDTDGDGYNEVVLVGKSGKITVYDTLGATPNPAPRTWVQGYSERRDNVPLYVPPPGAGAGPAAPQLSGESPDGTTNVPLGPTLSINVQDFQNQPIDLTFEVAAAGSTDWQTVKTYTDVVNGTYTAATGELVALPNTQYQWRITAVDSQNNSTQKTFTFTTAAPAGDWYQGWTYRRKITIASAMTQRDLMGFSTLVDLTLPSLATHGQSNGNDILFTSADGVTKLSHELESYDPATGHVVAWVKLPSISASADTGLYLYYGNAQAGNQQNATDVWDSNYRTVQHLEETSGLATDSTSNARNFTVSGGVTRKAAGMFGNGYSFDGLSGSMSLPQLFTNEKAFTVEAWANSGNKQGYIFNQRVSSGKGVLLQYYAPSKQYEFMVGTTKLVAPAAADTWYYVSASFDGTTARLYLNGKLVASAAATLTWPTQATYIGSGPALSRPFTGRLDEVRISNTARSGDYVLAAYNNRHSLNTLLTIGDEEIRV